jgi:hypothetical protein
MIDQPRSESKVFYIRGLRHKIRIRHLSSVMARASRGRFSVGSVDKPPGGRDSLLDLGHMAEILAEFSIANRLALRR